MDEYNRKEYFTKAFKFFIFAIIIMIIASVVTYAFSSNLQSIGNSTSQVAVDSGLDQKKGLNKVTAYFFNNGFKVPLQMFIFALIPIPYLYLLNIVISAIPVGILFGVGIKYSLVKGSLLIISAFPYMVVELFALSIFAAALDEINIWVRGKIWRRIQTPLSLSFELKQFFLRYLKYVIPLIIVAAFLETYAADWIYRLFNL